MSMVRRQTNLGPHGLPEVLFSRDELQRRIAELAADISRDYRGRELTLIGILKGSFIFLSDLARMLNLPVMIEFMGISSYGSQTHSSGVVRITSDLKHSIEGLDVLIVEDIVDTGLTASYLRDTLALREPASLRVCSLLHKPARCIKEVAIDYLGFTIPDRFVVGYGLDFEGRYRNLDYIGYFPDQPGRVERRGG